MIKQLGKHDRLLSPFVVARQWVLSNVDPQEVVLTELTGSEEPVALEFADYTNGPPFVNRECNIALEQQASDLAIPEAGKKSSGTFFPDREETNQKTHTFKRLIYDQIQRAFYNDYRNPLQIFGIDNIDFPLSKTDRFIGNEFLMFTIPRNVFGYRLAENTIQMFDHTFDDNLVIKDDGDGNLIAGLNLFSKVQEIRIFGNSIFTGSLFCDSPIWNDVSESWDVIEDVWNGCSLPNPDTCSPFGPPYPPSDLFVISGSAILSWNDNSSNEDGFVIERSLNGITFAQYATMSADSVSYVDLNVTESNTYWYRVFAFNNIGVSGYSNTASISFISPPSSPSNLVVVSGSAILSWDDNSFNEDGFGVQRSVDSGSTYTTIQTTSTDVTGFIDTTVIAGGAYTYRIYAFNDAGSSSFSNTASISFASGSPSAGPEPLAWWTMEETGSVDRIDVVNANHLQNFSQFGGTVSRDTGKVNFATKLRITASSFGSAADLETTTTVSPPDLTSGFHFVSWVAFDSWDANAWYFIVNNTIDGPFVSLQAIWQSSTNEVLVVQDINIPNAADFSASFTPTPGQFYFFNIFWDAADQKFGLQINNGSITKSPVAVPIGSPTDIFIDISLQTNTVLGNPSNAVVRVDEYGVYGKKLNSGQTDFLYNSGNGQTWPFTLPA